MSEDYDYEPADWSSNTDFKSARKAYKSKVVDRGYSDPTARGIDIANIVPESLTTDCEAPVLIVCDQTGSMGDWPAVIFSKLPYLDYEMRTEYRGEDVETAFLAIGDAHNHEKYPLQARPFTNGEGMQDALQKLIIERGGGGTMQETYELAALYLARKLSTPKALKKPIVIFIGDEDPYPSISPAMAKSICRVKLNKHLPTQDAFDELKAKCSVYMVLKPYNTGGTNKSDATNERIYNNWSKLLGPDYVAPLPQAERVVDVIFGILAREAGRIDYFRKEIEARQAPEQVESVYTALHSIHLDEEPTEKLESDEGKSVLALPGPSKGGKKKKTQRKKTKRLL